ncbi:MAG: hypothetical protein FJ091_02805 [Deltaproteobacteria bacterium]|nr:hypothetical protein [Deltaproteobacteria bacterium]
MTRRILAASLALLLLPALSGCWVLDELDSGIEKIDKHSGGKKQNTPSTATQPAAAAEPKKGAVDDYFRKENEAGTTRTISPGQVSEGIVNCRIGESMQFMTKDACAARGGIEGA